MLRLLAPTSAPIELAQAEVAVGDKRRQPELLGNRERVPIVARCVDWAIAARGDLAEEPERTCLIVASTALARKGQSSLCQLKRLREPVRENVRLTQVHEVAQLVSSISDRLAGAQR